MKNLKEISMIVLTLFSLNYFNCKNKPKDLEQNIKIEEFSKTQLDSIISANSIKFGYNKENIDNFEEKIFEFYQEQNPKKINKDKFKKDLYKIEFLEEIFKNFYSKAELIKYAHPGSDIKELEDLYKKIGGDIKKMIREDVNKNKTIARFFENAYYDNNLIYLIKSDSTLVKIKNNNIVFFPIPNDISTFIYEFQENLKKSNKTIQSQYQ